jgi:acetyl-CoA synthetase
MHDNIESHLVEKRVFKPAPGFSSKARIKSLAQYRRMYRESIRQPAKFWAREAKELVWRAPWKKVLEWKPPFAKWFVGGKLNVSENCLDRHLAGSRRNKAAIIWEGEPGDKRTLTYQQLHREVCRFANVLKRNNIKKGDRVIIYLPNIPRRRLPCWPARESAQVHSVVFGGFSADSIRDRINDSGAIALITADGSYRRGGIVPLKKNVDDALRDGTSVRRVIVFRRAANDIHMEEGRDVWWHRELEYVDANCPPAPLDSEHPLYLLYTSGSTGKPKGILHTTGGYLVTFIAPPNTSSTSAMRIFFGAQPMLGGSPVTATSSMVRSRMAQPLSCTRAHRTGPSPIGFGESSKSIGSTFFILPRRRSAHSSAGATIGSGNTISHRCGC